MKGCLHFDYAYVAAMGDIQQHKALHDQNCRERLILAGAVEEDFWGELTVSEEVREMLRPVFFGKMESEAVVVSYLPESENYDMRFHWLLGECRMVVMKGGKMIIRRMTKEGLAGIIFQLMPQGYNDKEVPASEVGRLDKRERTIVLKNIVLDGNAVVCAYEIRNGWLCWQNEKEDWKILSPKLFYDMAMKILEGGEADGIPKQ